MIWGVVNDAGGSPRIILTGDGGSTAEVLLHGGKVVSWKINRKDELLFRSSKGSGKPPINIRGGIPISFPQFSSFVSKEQHDLARSKLWSFDSCPSPLSSPKNNSSVDLVLKSTEDDLKIWPHRFELRLRVILGDRKLTLIPRVRNVDSKPFSFFFSMKSYLSVSDISEVRIEGLETLDYFDNLKQQARVTEQADSITFDGEVDRVYLSTPTKIAVIDHERKRTLVLRKAGLPDAGVWNPWGKTSKLMVDLGDADYESMLCMSSAALETPILLKPSEEWTGHQELSVISSSYVSSELDPSKVLYG